jgi:hypothetical protein
MKKLLLTGFAMLLAVAAVTERPVHACNILAIPCDPTQCNASCRAQGSSGGTCVQHPCYQTCVCGPITAP